ncbi:hypothetical protein SAMN05444481_12761 [Flavobacterium frigidimaris]|jgi:hypothetical protein|nr:hypothetical protein SAMN05444481_12761 [Flavobacterium frigidimaris]
MEGLMFLGFILVAMFFIGLGGLIFAKENKKLYLRLLLIPIIIAVIGFGTCVVILSNF